MKEVRSSATAQTATFRVTRARAASYHVPGEMLPPKPPKHQDQKRNLRLNKKRVASDENNFISSDAECQQRKKRAALKDVSNVYCENSYKNCMNAVKIQIKNSKPKRSQVEVSKVTPSSIEEIPHEEKKVILEGGKADYVRDEVSSMKKKENAPLQLNTENNLWDITLPPGQFGEQRYAGAKPECRLEKAERVSSCGKLILSSHPVVKDIDFDHRNPQLCSLYVAEIYSNLRVAELIRRPCPMFMETIQSDVTDGMRGILVDWLVEVSEEYKLVPDTLYLTVYFIDLFLSRNYIERQRLQLLGITCMLIASKYEEICAPRVEEFCFITDNTYSRAEVLEMESRVLNYLAFQLFAPTTKTFLRRFLRAAQATYKGHNLQLEYLANYLAELTLVDYSFLNYLPSIIAAAAVFLARWTLDQTGHPWNPTLEHYTTYTASDLETPAFALQHLQLNSKGCTLNAVRAKYRQDKFKAVATLPSPRLLQTLFQIPNY